MEFIIFLSKIDKGIIELINKTNHSIEENTALCLIDKKYVGFFKRGEKSLIICTKNAKILGNYKKNSIDENHKTKLYIRRALRHEATHAIQKCNNNKVIGDIKKLESKLNQNKRKALEFSTSNFS